MSMAAGTTGGAVTGADLWQQYVKTPDTHKNIPNCSYAGYHAGEAPLPTPKVAANVKESGAKGDGKTDDTAAFAEAIEQAHKAGGGAVLVPAGTYALEGIIHLKYSNVVLRGEGRDKTTLVFSKPLGKLAGTNIWQGGSSGWSWMGGLVWVGPTDMLNADGTYSKQDDGEDWQNVETLANVTAPAKRGDSVIKVDTAAKLKAGDYVLVAYENAKDHSLLVAMAGDPKMAQYPWDRSGRNLTLDSEWLWPVQVAKVEGNNVTFKQPLRVEIRSTWKVRLTTIGPVVQESGVEGMTLKMLNNERYVHLKDIGYNGIYFDRAVNCWARDVKVLDGQNGIILASSKNVTVRDFVISGRQHHHATALRVSTHDCLFEKFTIESKPAHGINTEGLSTGNVWHDGTMAHGTFDSHRAMSFELMRTNITVNNDGKPGGGNQAGPFLGARVVHWNIRATGSSEFVNQPDCISDGALVGVQGVPVTKAEAWAMVPGDKNCIIADEGKAPMPADLYEAQVKLRLKK